MIDNNKKGFTMIELVTVIVVLSILSLFTFSFVGNASKTYTLVKEQSVFYAEGFYIMERITKELSDATTVAVPSSLGPTFHELTFNKVHPSATAVTFIKNGRDLTRNGVIMGRNIKTFNVTKSLPSGALNETIEIVLELDSLSDTSIPEFSVTTTITPNNYPGGYTGRSFNGDYYEVIQ
jgi:prepilin-type N-terminal cleavage/methylation domain-containing protein